MNFLFFTTNYTANSPILMEDGSMLKFKSYSEGWIANIKFQDYADSQNWDYTLITIN